MAVKWDDATGPKIQGPKWVITDYEIRCDFPDVHFRCVTDVPIYMCARVGFEPPTKGSVPHKKRGQVFWHDEYIRFPYSYVRWQLEKSMTTAHTFSLPTRVDRYHLYWFCIGRETGRYWRWSPSRSPFFDHICLPVGPPVLKYAPAWDYYFADMVFNDHWYGERFTPPQEMKLRRIAVPLSIRDGLTPEEQCEKATMILTTEPVCGGGYGTIIGTAETILPELPLWPHFKWIEFYFDDPQLFFGSVYGWLVQGCHPFPNPPLFRIARTVSPGDAVCLHKLFWEGTATPPLLHCDAGGAQPFKMWRAP